MYKTNAMLMSDYYKQGHPEFYPKGLDYLASYGTARMSRLNNINSVVAFGFQCFAMSYLIDRFNDTFFNRPKDEAVEEVQNFISETFDCSSFDIQRIADLHDLGYLPVRLWAVPEGVEVPIYSQKEQPGVVQVPFMMYESTNEKFAWVTEFLESITSCQTWYPLLIATISKYGYRDIVDKHWEKSVVGQPACTAISEFGFRGAQGSEGAILASSGFLTSFNKTATCPAITFMKHYYGKGMKLKDIGSGMSSTEHSVMCSNFAVDGDEDTFMLRLFKEIAPNANVSVVSDSYDYWGRIEEMGREGSSIKAAILARNGCVYVRGDSGNPADIICGTDKYIKIDSLLTLQDIMDKLDSVLGHGKWYFKVLDRTTCKMTYYMVEQDENGKCKPAVEVKPELSDIGTVEALFNAFGGHVNEKGYIVINDKVRAIYGDSITPYLADVIYSRLEKNGYAANNVALGAGSFSMQAWEEFENGTRVLKPHTRDTFGIAFKATYCEVNGEKHAMFKDPKTDSGSFKRSQRGMVEIYKGDDGKLHARDGLTKEEFHERQDRSLFRPIYEDGQMLVVDSLEDIRNRLHKDNF